jgi:hypothetical protein
MLPTLPSALLLDDGELDDVRALLDGLEAQVDHLRSKEVAAERVHSYDVVVSTVGRARALADCIDARGPAGRPIWIAIHGQDFLPLRARLRELGVNFLVRSSADPEVLRLLLLHALYRGPERRSAPRLPIGASVSCHVEGDWHAVTLVDLTPEGCRLTSPQPVAPGSPILVVLPADLAGGAPLELGGRAVRVECDGDDAAEDERQVAVEFDEAYPECTRRLRAIVEGKAIGTAVTRLAEHTRPLGELSQPSASAETQEEEILLDAAERRRSARVAYERRVTALAGEATKVILGRDLSVEGMRVEPESGLKLGTQFRLGIYGRAREEPIIVSAFVARDDGRDGLAIRFHPGETERRRLEELVSALPAIESLSSGPGEPGPVVVSKTVPEEPSAA